MSANTHGFVAWEEHIISHERGNRLVHFYLRDALGAKVLAVIGTERSIRHMLYVVADDFVQAHGTDRSINVCTKWRARREVVDWLVSLVSKNHSTLDNLNAEANGLTQAFGSLDSSPQTHLPDQMVSRKFKVQSSDFVWSGVTWLCSKQLEHYPAFLRNGTVIAVHSFVSIMAEKGSNYLGYIEDMYEDKKRQKKVKVRWFHHNQEVKGVTYKLNSHPREVFITPHVQVISAECIDGPATVLTPKHFEKCLTVLPHTLSSGVYMCFRQFKNSKVKSFTLTKLRGYSNQAILSRLNGSSVSKQEVKGHKLNGHAEEEFTHLDPTRKGGKRNTSCREQPRHETSGVKNSNPESQVGKCEPRYQKLKIKFSMKPPSISQCPLSSMVGKKIELLCQDSGIRGCWFRCTVLQTSQKNLKVQYDDVHDVEGSGNLEEWVPASRVAAPDKLGMRCSGRLIIRPCPPDDSKCCYFEVGAPVDAWWSGGWWEGVVTQVDKSSNDNLQVYFPGENMFRNFARKSLRTSRDWVGNTWVDIKAKPDVLSYVSATVSPNIKLSTCGGSKLEEIKEEKQELCGSIKSNNLAENVVGADSRKRARISNGGEVDWSVLKVGIESVN